MKRNIVIGFLSVSVLIAVMVIVSSRNQPGMNADFPGIDLSPRDRILILAPHPDDEVLGCGGIIQRAHAMGIPVKIVFLTYGDNNQWSFLLYRKHPVLMPKAVQDMGLIRHDEALSADKVLGVPSSHLVFLGYPDFRTLAIWYSHWADRPAAASMLTGVKAVPYANAFRPGAPYKGEEILADLKTIFRDFKPTKIFLSHPADHNPDHRSLYLFSRVALWDLENEMKPGIYPYLVHYKKWPLPRGYNPEFSLVPPALFRRDVAWKALQLTSGETAVKYAAITRHRSQYRASKKYLLSFIRANELFGDFAPVFLPSQSPFVALTSQSKEDLATFPEQLIDEERALFVGIEKRSVARVDDDLVITTTLSRPLGNDVGVSIYVFGYRSDKDFKDMPKLHIRFGAVEHEIFDQDRPLAKDTVTVTRTPKEIVLHIPLKILGTPQRILSSANTYVGAVPLDWAAWRILEIKDLLPASPPSPASAPARKAISVP